LTTFVSADQLPYLLECMVTLFHEIWCLTVWGHLRFVYETPNWTASDQITLSWTKPRPASPNYRVRSVILCSKERQFITGILGQPVGPFFKSQEIQKKQHTMTEIIWHNLLFWVLSIQFFKEARRSEFSSVSVFRQRRP